MLVTVISAILLCARSMSDPFLVDVYVQSMLKSTVQVTKFADKNISGYSVSFYSDEKPGKYTNDVMENEVIAFAEQSQFSNSVYIIHGRKEYPLFVLDLSATLDAFTSALSAEEKQIVLPAFSSYTLPESFSILDKYDGDSKNDEEHLTSEIETDISITTTTLPSTTNSTGLSLSQSSIQDAPSLKRQATEILSATTQSTDVLLEADVADERIDASIKLRDGVLVITVPDFDLVLSAQRVR